MAEKYTAWSPYNYTFNNPIRFIDPTGLAPEDIILVNCQCDYVEQFVQSINENFNGQFQAYTEGYGENSVRLRIEATEGGGDLSKLSEGQQAFYKSIHNIAERQTGIVNLEIVSGDASVHTGRYDTGKIDIADIQEFPVLDGSKDSQEGPTQAGKIVHEVQEQYFKQVVDGNRGKNTKGFGTDDSGNHGGAILFENSVNGNKRRGNTYTQPNGAKYLYNVNTKTGDGVISVTKKKIN